MNNGAVWDLSLHASAEALISADISRTPWSPSVNQCTAPSPPRNTAAPAYGEHQPDARTRTQTSAGALHIQSPGPQTRAWRTQRRRITRGRGYCCCVSPPWCSVNHTDARLSELFLRVDSRMSRVVLAVDWSCVAFKCFRVYNIYLYKDIWYTNNIWLCFHLSSVVFSVPVKRTHEQ